MTILEYIRQLPGKEDTTVRFMACPKAYGLDIGGACPLKEDVFLDCKACMSREATIGGKPAPYLFSCPVKPGQTVYFFDHYEADYVIELVVMEIKFWKSGYIITTCNMWYEFSEEDWLVTFFPTREAAEKRMAEMRGEAIK